MATREPTHQLVIQFPESAFPDFDDVVRYEDTLIDALGDAHEVDGHDIGSGEVNFFVFTNDPTAALGAIREARGGALLSHPDVRAAARLVESEDFSYCGPSATGATSLSFSDYCERTLMPPPARSCR